MLNGKRTSSKSKSDFEVASIWGVHPQQSQGSQLLGTKELDERLKLRYKGKSPKKRLTANVNYYDHNVLGLENRLVSAVARKQPTNSKDPDAIPLFESIDTNAKRSKSQPAV